MVDAAPPNPCDTLAPSLSGLLDGELTWSERVVVEQHLRACPACAHSLEQARAARQTVRSLYGQLATPLRLQDRVRSGLAQAQSAEQRRWLWGVTAGGIAAVLALVAVVGTMWFLQGGQRHALAERAVAAHHMTQTPGTRLVTATGSVEDIAQWASVATGRSIDVPDFTDVGYRLLGVRAEPAVANHAVAMVYAGENGALTCVVIPGHWALSGPVHGPAQIHLTAVRGTAVAGWWEGETTYLLIGDVPPALLLTVALTAPQQ